MRQPTPVLNSPSETSAPEDTSVPPKGGGAWRVGPADPGPADPGWVGLGWVWAAAGIVKVSVNAAAAWIMKLTASLVQEDRET